MTQRKIERRQHLQQRNGKKQLWALAELMESRFLLSGTAASVSENVVHDPVVQIGSAAATPATLVSTPSAPISVPAMRGAYGLGTYNNSNVTFNGVQGDGTGQTIAIYEDGDEPTIKTDLTAFDAYWKLPDPPSFRVLDENGGTSLLSPGDEAETALDVEWAHTMAPGASLVILEGGSIATAVETAKAMPAIAATATTPYIGPVSVITISYTSSTAYTESDFATPTGHTGVTTMSSAGDTGGEVKYPANDYEVIAVGGTDLYTSGTTYSSEVAWSSGGGGITPVSQPSYQNGIVSAFSTTYRTTPDVALEADPSTGVAIYDAYENGTSTPWNEDEGGTSLSSPLMAGIVAVADQGRVAAGLTTMDGYTQTLPRIYTLSSSNFHDVTTGNNGNAAGVGYDLATGLGSPKGNYFIPDLAGADTITGKVYLDANGNGTFDGTDTAMASKTVYLDINNNGVENANEPTAVTNSSGGYLFTDVIGGATGTVRLTSLPAGDLHSTSAAGFTTAYDATQTVNIGFYPSTYVANASPSTVTGTTTTLSLTGTAPADAAGFFYTWATTSAPTGGTPTFSSNGTVISKSTTATFNKAGSYVFTVTINDNQGSTVTSTVNVTVNQTLTAITVTPATVNVFDAGTNQFSAVGQDQFSNPLAIQPAFTWSVDSGGLGSVDTNGVYTAPASGAGSATVRATSGSVSGTASVTVILSMINGTSGDDTIRLLRSGTNLLVYVNNASSPVYTVPYATLGSLLVSTGTGNDSVNVDYSGLATPVPAGGLTVDGGTNSTTDNLIITGTSSADNVVINGTTASLNGSSFTYASFEAITFNGHGSADTLTQMAQPGNAATVTFNGGTVGGTTTLDSLNVSGGTYTFPQPAAGSGVAQLQLGSLIIGASSSVSIPTAATHSDRWVLALGSLAINGGQLDLGGNDMLVHNGSTGAIFQSLQSGFASGAWNGTGIASAAAVADPTHTKALGMMPGVSGGTFDQLSTTTTDVLVKYTYYGDANLSGVVDGSDYSKIDYGNLPGTGATGWANGDFNYDGVIDGSDYTLIDNVFNSQGASLAAVIAPVSATPAVEIEKPTVIDDSAKTVKSSSRASGFSDLPLFTTHAAVAASLLASLPLPLLNAGAPQLHMWGVASQAVVESVDGNFTDQYSVFN